MHRLGQVGWRPCGGCNGERVFWVSCGSGRNGKTTAPAGLFSFGSLGDSPLGMLDGSVAGTQTYDPFATWVSSAGHEYQLLVATNDVDSSSRSDVTACLTGNCNADTTFVVGTGVYAAFLSARVLGDKLLVLANVDNVAAGGGCCSEQLLVYKITESQGGAPQISSEFATLPLDGLVPEDSSAKVSHTFFSYAEGDTARLLLCMNGASKEYVVRADLDENSNGFSLSARNNFEVPGSNHINGVTRFESAGVTYIATTSKGQGLWLFAEDAAFSDVQV